MLSKSTIELHLQRMIELFHILAQNIICNHFLFSVITVNHQRTTQKIRSRQLNPLTNHTTMQSNHGTTQEPSKAITVKSSTRA